MMKDDEEKNGQIAGSIRAMTMKFEIDTVHFKNSHSKEQSKTHGCLSPAPIIESPRPLIVSSLSVSHYPVIELNSLSVKMIAE